MNGQISKPWEKVTDPGYFRKVLGNMSALGWGPRKPGAAHVRFGLTGIGHAPNYQIEGPEGSKRCFRGMGHEKAAEVDEEFAPENLSEQRFTYAEVQQMLARLSG